MAAAESKSLTTSVPPVESTILVSVSWAVALVSVDTSSVPVMFMVTVPVPPSELRTTKVSVTTWPAFSEFNPPPVT